MIYVIDRTQQLPEDFFSEHLPGSILEDGYLLTHNGITYELERCDVVGVNPGDLEFYVLNKI